MIVQLFVINFEMFGCFCVKSVVTLRWIEKDNTEMNFVH